LRPAIDYTKIIKRCSGKTPEVNTLPNIIRLIKPRRTCRMHTGNKKRVQSFVWRN